MAVCAYEIYTLNYQATILISVQNAITIFIEQKCDVLGNSCEQESGTIRTCGIVWESVDVRSAVSSQQSAVEMCIASSNAINCHVCLFGPSKKQKQ
jgi:hypothetical protein